MKKQDIILIAGAVLVFIIAIFALGKTNANPTGPLALSGEEKELTEINYSTYEEKIANGDNFIVIIERTKCTYCIKYMPVVEEVTKELAIPVYYINTDNLSQDEFTSLNNSNSYLKRKQWGTPTTLLLSGNKVIDSISGYVEKEKFIEFINKNVITSQNDSNE